MQIDSGLCVARIHTDSLNLVLEFPKVLGVLLAELADFTLVGLAVAPQEQILPAVQRRERVRVAQVPFQAVFLC